MLVNSIFEIFDALPLKQDSVVLDIYSGVGTLAVDLMKKNPQAKILAIEKNIDKLNTLNNKKIKAIKYDVDNGKSLPLRDNFCDVIIIAHALRSLIYRESLLKDCKRILKPGGLIIVAESKIDSFSTSIHPDSKIIFDDMLEYLDRSGFLLGESFDTKSEEYVIIGVCPAHNNEE
jgi:ubiquinone/menaquinone biosynthesis C-methylase UbiE